MGAACRRIIARRPHGIVAGIAIASNREQCRRPALRHASQGSRLSRIRSATAIDRVCHAKNCGPPPATDPR
jgi:hypothetical protein